jgi:hypothetical protein
MIRRLMNALMIATVVLLSSLGVESPALGAPTSLVLPQGAAFAILGHSCGGIQENVLATGFDATSGFPTGAVYMQTRCGGSGRDGGGHVTTYSAWADVTWDYTGALVSYSVLPGQPAGLDPAFSAFDSFGNEVYTVSLAGCTVVTVPSCSFVARLALAPTFVPPPRLLGISVTIGPASGGTSVTLTGTGFTGATAVHFGVTAAAGITVNSDTSITAVSPVAEAGTVDITVTSAGGTSATSPSDQFTFFAIPVVSSLSPNSGPIGGGTPVTITGTNFTGATAVFFGDMPAGFVVNDDTSITAVSPGEGSPDDVAVTVTSPGGTSAMSAADQFTYISSTTIPTSSTTSTTLSPCSATPVSGCQGAAALKASLVLGNGKLTWKWTSSGVVATTDFGSPPTTTDYLLCVYDASGERLSAQVAAGGMCGTRPCWKALGTVGFKYADTTGMPDGLTKVLLKAGSAGRGKVGVNGSGPNLHLPALLLTLPVTVQLQQDASSVCWEATYSMATMNTASAFKAKSD